MRGTGGFCAHWASRKSDDWRKVNDVRQSND
jgi:hypothetical protein